MPEIELTQSQHLFLAIWANKFGVSKEEVLDGIFSHFAKLSHYLKTASDQQTDLKVLVTPKGVLYQENQLTELGANYYDKN